MMDFYSGWRSMGPAEKCGGIFAEIFLRIMRDFVSCFVFTGPYDLEVFSFFSIIIIYVSFSNLRVYSVSLQYFRPC